MTSLVSSDDTEVLGRFPSVRLDHLNKRYYQGLLRRELVAGRCRACGRWHTPPRPICPSCWSSEVGPAPVSGRGTVHLLTFLLRGRAGRRQVPGAQVALLTPGGFFFNAQGLVLRAG